MLNLDGKSSGETIWILLAKLLVPLPRWDRGEILMKFCRVVSYEPVVRLLVYYFLMFSMTIVENNSKLVLIIYSIKMVGDLLE